MGALWQEVHPPYQRLWDGICRSLWRKSIFTWVYQEVQAVMKKIYVLRPDFDGALAYIDQYGRQVCLISITVVLPHEFFNENKRIVVRECLLIIQSHLVPIWCLTFVRFPSWNIISQRTDLEYTRNALLNVFPTLIGIILRWKPNRSHVFSASSRGIFTCCRGSSQTWSSIEKQGVLCSLRTPHIS